MAKKKRENFKTFSFLNQLSEIKRRKQKERERERKRKYMVQKKEKKLLRITEARREKEMGLEGPSRKQRLRLNQSNSRV